MNSKDVLALMGTVIVMDYVTQILDNASVIRCGLQLTVEPQIVWEHHLVQVMAVAMLITFLDDVTVIVIGLGMHVTYLVIMA